MLDKGLKKNMKKKEERKIGKHKLQWSGSTEYEIEKAKKN